jgi:hypothetical protein
MCVTLIPRISRDPHQFDVTIAPIYNSRMKVYPRPILNLLRLGPALAIADGAAGEVAPVSQSRDEDAAEACGGADGRHLAGGPRNG